MIHLYHNPRCGKSRTCLAFLIEKDPNIKIINYLKTPPTKDEIKELLQKLKLKPLQLIRTKEPLWIENYKNSTPTDDELIQAMSEHPILIERPIVIDGDKAIIGRIPEALARFLSE